MVNRTHVLAGQGVRSILGSLGYTCSLSSRSSVVGAMYTLEAGIRI